MAGVRIDLTDKRIGILTLVSFSHSLKRDRGSRTFWKCECDCGTVKVLDVANLGPGRTESCGCIRKAKIKAMKKHGETIGGSRSAEYTCWQGMKQRCYDKNNPWYASYGGRGIAVCERWKDSFANFLADMGRKPSPAHSIDRKENDGNYEPDNCKWSTGQEQANNRRNNRILVIDGVERTLQEWADLQGVNQSAIVQRLRRGWNAKAAVTKPMRAMRHLR